MDVHDQMLFMRRATLYSDHSGRSSSWEAQGTGGMQISMEEKEEMKDPKLSTMFY